MNLFKNLSRSVKGKIAIITGAGSGMGEATAKVFATEAISNFEKPNLVPRQKNLI